MVDCLIIGGGPAGLLAAIYLGRFLRKVQVIDAGESRAARIPESHNYPGFFGIAGLEILSRLRAQAEKYGAQLLNGRVTSLRKKGTAFVATGLNSEVPAQFVLLATGLVDHCPPIHGKPGNYPTDAIRFCPICDGYEAIDRRVGVLGNLAMGGEKALFLRTYTRNVLLFLNEEETGNEQQRTRLTEVDVRIDGKVQTVQESTNGAITILTENGRRHEVDALYPALGCTVRSDLARALGASCSQNGNLIVDAHQRTTLDGVYAAGDVVTDLHQLSVAFGHAAIAATDIHNSLPPNPR